MAHVLDQPVHIADSRLQGTRGSSQAQTPFAPRPSGPDTPPEIAPAITPSISHAGPAIAIALYLFKNVTIFAGNWAGSHAPTLTSPRDPAAGTTRGLGDFTKPRAAQEAVSAGFADFQFVDPETYRLSQVAPVTGPSLVTCGIRPAH